MESNCCARADGTCTWNPEPSSAFELRLHVSKIRPVLHRQIDAIELPAASENLLRGVNVHHREVPAEGAGQSARFHDAANGEQLPAVHGAHRNLRAHAQMILARVRVGDHQRIGLCKEHERIVDVIVSALAARFQIVVAQAAIARHIHAQDQEIALPLDAGANHCFDHRHRDAHFRKRLHALQNIFIEARFAGRNLQLRGSRDAVHGLMKRIGHGLIGRVDADKHRDTEHDSSDSEQPARQMLPDVGPANEFQQDHEEGRIPCPRDLLQRARRAGPPGAHSSRPHRCRA